jgi:hypothetical protein
MNKKNVIMASGLISSGKDTLADLLVKFKGYKKFSLASVLKKFASEKYGFDENLCHTQEGKKTIVFAGKTVRELLIIESEAAKAMDKYYFADKVIKCILQDDSSKIVISDFRFPEEYLRFKEFFSDVKTVKVVRASVKPQDFASEHQLDNFLFDLEISNDGSLKDFENYIISEFFYV